MISFFAQNLGTIAVGLLVAGAVAAIVAKLIRDKHNGKCTGCDCSCGGCPSRGSCGGGGA
jgi:hypothetical protein